MGIDYVDVSKSNTDLYINKVMMGFYEVDITPASSVEMVGFGPKMSCGLLSPLLAQISVWQIKNKKYCLIGIDHIGFLIAHADTLRSNIAKILGTDKESIMLCFAHTHAAPNDSSEPEYFKFLCEKVEEGVKQALKNMSLVKAAWGNAYGDIGVNRRDSKKNKVDRRMGILKVADYESGRTKLLILRLTAHGNVLKADNELISADYFGEVRKLLKEKYQCDVMVTQGAAGNVAPKYFKSKLDFVIDTQDPQKFVRSETALKDMASVVYKSVDKVLDTIVPKDIKNLEVYSIYKDFYADVPSYKRALKIAEEAKKACNIDGENWLKEVRRLNNEGIKEQTDTTEIQYFVMNNGCLCGSPDEIMCEAALNAEEKTGNHYFYLGGYTNGCTGYLPTGEEFDEGGYEVYWSMLFYYIYFNRVFPLKRDSLDILVDTAVKNYHEKK